MSISKISRITKSSILFNLNYKSINSIQSINYITKESKESKQKPKQFFFNLSKNILA